MRRALPVLVLFASACGAAPRLGAAAEPRTVLQVFDASTGSTRWTRELSPTDGATEPVLIDDVVLVAAPGGSPTTAYALSDGTPRWSVPEGDLPQAVVVGRAVFDLRDRVEARRVADGSLAWSVPSSGDVVQSRDTGIVLLEDPSQPTADCSPCTVTIPAPTGPAVTARGTATRLDPRTGKRTWQATVSGHPDSNTSAVSATLALVGVTSDQGGHSTVVALDLATGRPAWTFTSDYIGGTAVSGDVAAVTTGTDDPTAHALDSRTGKETWSSTGEESLLRDSPFLGVDRRQRGFRRDPATGRELPGRVPFTYGLAAHGDVLVGAGSRELTAVRGSSRLWVVPLPSGPRPASYVAVDASVVAVVTGVGQEETGD